MADAEVGPERLKNSVIFNRTLKLNYPELTRYSQQVARSVYQRCSARHPSLIELILGNLFIATLTDSTRTVALPLNHDAYRLPNRYDPEGLTYERIRSVILRLSKRGLIGFHKGFPPQGDHAQGRLSRIWPRAELMDFLNSIPPPLNPPVDPRLEVIELRAEKVTSGKAGVKLDYRDTDETNGMRRRLLLINQHLSQQWIDLFVTQVELDEISETLRRDKDRQPFDPTRVVLKRIFNNGTFSDGGRFYGGWWMEIPNRVKSWREFITINGQHTVEMDYSGMHIEMLYAKSAHTCPDEPYCHPAFDREDKLGRTFLKLAVNEILNADGRHKAIGAMESTARELRIELPIPADQILKDLKEIHSPISQYFHTGEGIRLQRLDSDLVEDVLCYFLRAGVTVLPVHDSFIINRNYASYLYDIMMQAFQRHFGVAPKIKFEEMFHHRPFGDANRSRGHGISSQVLTNLAEHRQITPYPGYSKREALWNAVLLESARGVSGFDGEKLHQAIDKLRSDARG